METKQSKEKVFIFGALFLTVALFFGFGFHHLTKFVTADEHYWIYERVPQYWDALTELKLIKTFINDKPGVTIALFSSPALLFERHPEKYAVEVDKDMVRFDAARMEKLLLAFRLPILLFCSLSLLYLFWIVKQVTDPWIALWTTIFTGLSPVILGISQIINPDAFLWIFSTAAIFSFIALLKYDQKKYLLLTMLFTGLGMLTKYSINILFPFYLFLIVFYYFSEKQGAEDIQIFFKKNLKYFSLIALGSLGMLAFFIPAIIIKPVYFYRMTMGVKNTWMMWLLVGLLFLFLLSDTFLMKNKILSHCKDIYLKHGRFLRVVPGILAIVFAILIVGRIFFDAWPLFSQVPFDLKNIDDAKMVPGFFEKIVLEFNPLVFSLTPLVLFLGLFTWIMTVTKKMQSHYFSIIALSFFILAYYASFLVANVLSTVRYSIPIYPLISFLAALGIAELSQKFKNTPATIIKVSATIIILIFSISAIYSVKPFYFNYVSPLLPKNQTVTDAWGFGGYEAVEYLKRLPDVQNLTIWSDYYGACEFFPGRCITDYQFDKAKYKIDYYVLTRRGRIKYTPFFNSRLGKKENFSQAFRYYDRTDPVWEKYINDRPQNYIKIFKSIE